MEGSVNKDFNEAEARFFVQLTRNGAVGAVGRDEGRQGDARRICKEFRDLYGTKENKTK